MSSASSYSSIQADHRQLLLGLEDKMLVEALVGHAADPTYGGLHVLHESWTKEQLARIHQHASQFIDGTFVECVSKYGLRVDLRDYLGQIRQLSRNGHQTPSDPNHVFHGQTIETSLSTYYPDPQWAVHGLIPEGCIILAGKPKHGKSYLALTLALAVAKQKTCLEHFAVSPGDVLYFSLEDYAKRVQKRLQRLYTTPSTAYTVEFIYHAPKMSEGFGQRLRATLEHRPAIRLVIIDTLRCIRDPQTEQYNLYQADSDFIGGLNDCAQHAGVTILIVHHTRKAKSEDIFDEISGTGGLRGATSANMVLEETAGEADAILKIEGKDFEHETHVALKRKADGSWTYAGEGEVYQLRANKRALLHAIALLGDSANPKDIWTESKIPSFGTVRSMLSRMASLGEVGKSTKGVYFVIESDDKGVEV